MTYKNIIAQGAEAKIILSENFVIKDRVSKSYRIKELDDKIRKRRTKKEAKIMIKASEIINCPKPVSQENNEIKIPYIDGKKLSTDLDALPLEQQKSILTEIGESVGTLHANEIIHGDLTTSNMILSNSNNKVYLIDFGLGIQSGKTEDKAVDLHLLKEALKAKHFKNHETLFNVFLNGYKKTYKDSEKTIERLMVVEKRGRYKGQY